MRKKLVYAAVIIAILAVGILYSSGFQVYQYQYNLSLKSATAPNPESVALPFPFYLESPSGTVLAELNFSSARLMNANNTQDGVGLGFRVWRAPGFNIELLNLSFDIAPLPADVWVKAFNYYTGSYPPLRVEIANFSGGNGCLANGCGSAGAVLTLSGFPPPDLTTEYGIGLANKNAELPGAIGSNSVGVQVIFTSGSGTPFAGNTYTGQIGYNLDCLTRSCL